MEIIYLDYKDLVKIIGWKSILSMAKKNSLIEGVTPIKLKIKENNSYVKNWDFSTGLKIANNKLNHLIDTKEARTINLEINKDYKALIKERNAMIIKAVGPMIENAKLEKRSLNDRERHIMSETLTEFQLSDARVRAIIKQG